MDRGPRPEKLKRRMLWLPIIDRYIFKEFMIPFSVLIIGFILLFMIGDIFDDLKDFLEGGASIATMTHYFILKLPGNIRFILPLSILLACMYTMASLGKNQEITAMRACGVSLFRCCGSIFVVALFVTMINFWFNEQLVPSCERQAYILRKSAQNENFAIEQRSMLQYRSNDKTRNWLFSYFDTEGVQRNVILKIFSTDNNDRRLQKEVRAQQAQFLPGTGWKFINATIIPYDKLGFMPGSPEKKAELILPIKESPEQIMNAVKDPESLPVWVIVDILKRGGDSMAENCRVVYETIFFHRLAFPWVCLLAVLLGVPLAAKNARGGIMVSVVSAVVIIVIFMMASNICVVLGKKGVIPPAVAGIAPVLFFLIYGWRVVVRNS